MARLARVVIAGVPHHVTQRGTRRQPTFFSDDDYLAYSGLLKEGCEAAGGEVWAYCLMPDHVHMILVPQTADGLRGALAETHRRYSRRVNEREGRTGFLWQGRFASAPMDDGHLMACARYVELNPLRAGLVEHPEDWRWSSASAHLSGRDSALVKVKPLLERWGSDWRGLLDSGLTDQERDAIRRSERTGRPLGAKAWVEALEGQLGRKIARQKPGPKRL